MILSEVVFEDNFWKGRCCLDKCENLEAKQLTWYKKRYDKSYACTYSAEKREKLRNKLLCKIKKLKAFFMGQKDERLEKRGIPRKKKKNISFDRDKLKREEEEVNTQRRKFVKYLG